MELLNHPAGVRTVGHGEVNNIPALMPNGEPYVEDLEGGCRDNEEVHRRDSVCVIAEKGDPSFDCSGRGRALRHVAGNGSLGEVEAEFGELSMDSRTSPAGVLESHPSDERSKLRIDSWTADFRGPGLSPPEGRNTDRSGESSVVPRFHFVVFWVAARALPIRSPELKTCFRGE